MKLEVNIEKKKLTNEKVGAEILRFKQNQKKLSAKYFWIL